MPQSPDTPRDIAPGGTGSLDQWKAWSLRASGQDGCQAFITHHFLWSEMHFFHGLPHIPGLITQDCRRTLHCCSPMKASRFPAAVFSTGLEPEQHQNKENYNKSSGLILPVQLLRSPSFLHPLTLYELVLFGLFQWL